MQQQTRVIVNVLVETNRQIPTIQNVEKQLKSQRSCTPTRSWMCQSCANAKNQSSRPPRRQSEFLRSSHQLQCGLRHTRADGSSACLATAASGRLPLDSAHKTLVVQMMTEVPRSSLSTSPDVSEDDRHSVMSTLKGVNPLSKEEGVLRQSSQTVSQPVSAVGQAPEEQIHQQDDQAIVRACDGERDHVKCSSCDATPSTNHPDSSDATTGFQ